MNVLSKIAMATLGLAFATTLMAGTPAFAQAPSTQSSNDANDATFGGPAAGTPQLGPVTNGTIGPQGTDATVVQGVNTAGTVRVNNLANLEALLNVIANLVEIVGLGSGLFLTITGISSKTKESCVRRTAIGIAVALVGLATPGCINWLV